MNVFTTIVILYFEQFFSLICIVVIHSGIEPYKLHDISCVPPLLHIDFQVNLLLLLIPALNVCLTLSPCHNQNVLILQYFF